MANGKITTEGREQGFAILGYRFATSASVVNTAPSPSAPLKAPGEYN